MLKAFKRYVDNAHARGIALDAERRAKGELPPFEQIKSSLRSLQQEEPTHVIPPLASSERETTTYSGGRRWDYPEMMGCFGPILSLITFFGIWIYCAATAGVWGFMLGWLAALVVAAIVFLLSPVIVCGLLILLILAAVLSLTGT